MKIRLKSNQKAKIGKIFLALFLMLFPFSLFAQGNAPVSADVNTTKARVNQPIAFTITVEVSGSESVGNPRLPDLNGFRLQNQMISTQARSEFVNGRLSFVKTQTFRYDIVPIQEGKLIIGEAEVVIGNETYRTAPIEINVSSGGAQIPSGPEDQEDVSAWDESDELFNQLLQRVLPTPSNVQNFNEKEAFFIRVQLDKKKAYVGEQITASWYLYTQNTLTNFEPIRYPELKGFWKEDIEIATRLNFEVEVINGIPYRKALLVSYALFPLKAGTATIDSYQLRASALIANNFGAFGKPFTFSKSSPVEKVEVIPLPTQQPEDFKGAVGQFRMRAHVDKQQVPANEPMSLKIKIEGRGNAKQIELPSLNLPSEFESFDTKSDSKFSKDGTSYKEFEVLLIPRREGSLIIPAITMSYFNPVSKSFEKLQSQPITINVGAGKSIAGGSQVPMNLPVASARKSLPLPVLEASSSFLFNSQLEKVMIGGSSFIFILSLIFFVFNEFKNLSKKDEISKSIDKRIKKINSDLSQENYKDASSQVLAMVDYTLNQIIESKESLSVDLMISKLPPSLRENFNEDFKKSLNYVETLCFAPEEISVKLRDKKQFNQNLKIIKKTILDSIQKMNIV